MSQPMSPVISPAWSEGDRLITVYRWIAEKHERMGGPLFVTNECCKVLEDAINDVYTTCDAAALKVALKAFGGHMVGHFQAAKPRRQEQPA